jgi:BioD-like phosphotransacetylase family protein
MSALYVTSLEAASGKSLFSAALGRRIQAEGKRVAFCLPVRINSEAATQADEDTAYVRSALSLPAEGAMPLSLTMAELESALSASKNGVWSRVQAACGAASASGEVSLVEGLSGGKPGSRTARASKMLAELLHASVLLIAGYRPELEAEEVAGAAKDLGGSIAGVLINAVPPRRLERTARSFGAALKEQGITLLGALPEDRALRGVTVGQLASQVEGDIVSGPDKAELLLEGIMIGALTADRGRFYFGHRANKAVVTRGDRPDVQMAALSTSTRCLVLTGHVAPHPRVVQRAEDQGVAIIVVEGDTPSTLERLGGLLERATFRNAEKIERMEQLLGQHLDSQALYAALGLN